MRYIFKPILPRFVSTKPGLLPPKVTPYELMRARERARKERETRRHQYHPPVRFPTTKPFIQIRRR